MKKKVAKLRLSPNEEARLLREEHERRRKLRIQQVREQQRYIAMQIRQEVERKRQQELEHLGKELRQDWERQQREKLQTLQRLYQESLQLLGQGHKSAKENEPDLAAVAHREEENHAKAEERYREALKELKSQRLKDHEMQSRAINARKKALQAEKERSAKVSSLPAPPPNPIQQFIDSKKPHVVRKYDVSAFADTHYHMSGSTVDKEADTQQTNAHERAELELRRLQDLQKEEMLKREEQLEKARLRGKQALRREQLMQDRERLLIELEHMQQTDLLRRRQQVSHIPPQIFHPLYKRQEMREDFQKEMEFAFEDMYTGERRVKGDLVVQLVPEPLPALSTGSKDQELDVTLDEIATPQTETTQPDTEQEAESTEQETSVRVEASQPKTAPRRVLKKLLDRIRSQRSQWTEPSSLVPAAELSILSSTDQIPEWDTTIDTGSLTSEERDKQPTLEHLQPPHSASAQKTTEVPILADTPLPDVLANRIEEFEEQKKKEEDLEREKQQQLFMLKELEEQKAKLEQLLIEAQQEREHLKVAVTQDLPVKQPEVPVRDHEITSRTPALSRVSALPADEVEHTRRIRQYQQRLLEQNRIDRRPLEEARQRLEEYQRALRIRYNMTSTSFEPAETQRPLLSTQSVNPPASRLLPVNPEVPVYIPANSQTSVDVPTRESDILTSTLQPPAFSVGSKSPPGEVECKYNSPRNQFGVTAWLTNNIMGRATEHLPQRVRTLSSNIEPLSRKSHHLTSILLESAFDSTQAVSPSITDGTAVVPDHADAKSGTFLQSYLQPVSESSKEDKSEQQRKKLRMGSLSSTEDDFEMQRQKQQIGSLSSRERDLENQRQELQEVRRWLLDQRDAVALQQRQQGEHRQRQEVQMEHMRRQKEALQALIHTDAQPVPAAADETVKQTRLKLLASLLRAIEGSNGGTLSHLEEPQEKHGSPQQSTSRVDSSTKSQVPATRGPASVLPSGLCPPPRAAKPPVTRVRLGIMEMTEQHELSAIPEVETPINTSLVIGREDSVAVSPHVVDSGQAWDLQEESDISVASDTTLQTPSVTSSGQQTDEGPTNSGTSSGRFNNLIWRERLLSGAGTCPESSKPDLVLKIISPLSSDSGRGADYSGLGYRSHIESQNRRADSDQLSSTTLSTGSYITTDPEQNTDNSLLVRHCEEQGLGEQLLNIPSLSGQSSCVKDDSSAGCPGLAVHSVFNDSSIQKIIDRYTRELNISLSTVGRITESEVEEPRLSVSQESLAQASERRGENEGSTCNLPLPPDTTGTQRCDKERLNTVPEHYLGEDLLLAEDPDEDSFRPLIGQLADESSLLAADQRELAMERLVGHPSAHSSMIGQASVSLDQGGWDSTLNRMIGRLSHMSGSHWLSHRQDFYAGQLVVEQSRTWLVEGQEESQMIPLVGELDDDQSGSSGERTCANVGVSTEAHGPSYPVLHSETSSQSTEGLNGHTHEQALQNQSDPMTLSPERTEGPVSFRSLLAEFTHNQTAEPSMTFRLLEHDVPNSSDEQPGSGEASPYTPSEGSEAHSDSTAQSESSPERLQAEEPTSCLAALCESFSNLNTFQSLPRESVLMVSPTNRTDGGPTDLTLSNLTTCEATTALAMQLPQELVSEKGILEQSEITLVSLTDTTLQDQDTTITEEEGAEENKVIEGVEEKEVSESTVLAETLPEDEKQLQPVKFLELHWCPSKDMQVRYHQKCKALLQKSCHRVEEIKARRALAKNQPENRVLSAAKGQSEADESQPLKITSGPQQKTKQKSKAGQAEQHQTSMKLVTHKKAPPPPTAMDSRLKKVGEVKICTPEERKKDVSEMHQRTQRLYEQLEEVKHQKVIRSRQAAYAENRLKAKEFHKKTLQKLRAKQTQQ
ncbi:hypothetical protein Q5P01_009575 [Channa striata]|uniref:Centrosomal protein of 295 kDa n=1 Tax=Channa striata TaxID=64152 RepID=A0AA88MZ35_CHASR|nr:hypothetical protein Q5P01_009575 [Channa striata]